MSSIQLVRALALVVTAAGCNERPLSLSDDTSIPGIGTTNEAVFYSAFRDAGSEHAAFQILKKVPDRDLCVVVLAEQGLLGIPFEVTMPKYWGVSGVLAFKGADNCAYGKNMTYPQADSVGGSGSITWSGAFPCTLTVNVTFEWDAELSWVPQSESLVANSIPVAYCK